jgi:hypothetical protein
LVIFPGVLKIFLPMTKQEMKTFEIKFEQFIFNVINKPQEINKYEGCIISSEALIIYKKIKPNN